MSKEEDRESRRTLADQIFARRMSEHLSMLASQAEALALTRDADLYFGERQVKLGELACSMRALAQIMYNESRSDDAHR